MKWTQTSPAILPVTYQQAAAHLRLVDDQDRDYVKDLIAAATEFAETALGASLITRTVTATFNQGEPLYLPRGPLISLTSVTQFGGHLIASPNCTIEGHGNADLLVIQANAWTAPLIVVYQAGYGPTVNDVPADIRMAIRMHTATLYENRESVADKSLIPVPHSLGDFYRLKSRQTGTG